MSNLDPLQEKAEALNLNMVLKLWLAAHFAQISCLMLGEISSLFSAKEIGV